MSMPYRNLLLLGILLAGSLWIAATRVRPEQATASPTMPATMSANAEAAPLPNHLAPDFILPDLSGNPTQLSDLHGKVVLINIWATWCPPCRAEMPMIQAAYENYQDQGFIVLAINAGEQQPTVADFMQAQGLSFPALLDQDGKIAGLYQARALPSSFFIDKAGVIRAVYRGPMTRSVITATVEQLLSN